MKSSTIRSCEPLGSGALAIIGYMYSMVSLVCYLNMDPSPPPLHPPYIIHVLGVSSPFLFSPLFTLYWTQNPRTKQQKSREAWEGGKHFVTVSPFSSEMLIGYQAQNWCCLGAYKAKHKTCSSTHTHTHTNDIKNCTKVQCMQPRCQSEHLHLQGNKFYESRQKSRKLSVYVKLIPS